MCYNIPMIDSEDTTEVKNTGDTVTAEDAPAREKHTDELIKTAVKAVAVTLSVVMLILSILTVAMPLSAMRVFNNLGMSERALNSGEEYISSHIRGAADTDELGNYTVLGASAAYVTDDFIEALDTCINLSDKLMREYASRRDDESTRHFAEKLERYTRMYSSLYGISEINLAKDTANIAAVPFASMRPYVYSYAHTLAELNYRARAYLGKTDNMLLGNYENGASVARLSERSNTFAGEWTSDTVDAQYSLLRSFAVYAAQLGEYVSVCFEKLCIERGTTAGDFERGGKYGFDKGPLLKTGNEFSLIVTPENGYTSVYNQLKNYGEYMQAAVDLPATTADRMLERLYIIGELSSTAQLLWVMETLLYHNRDFFGVSMSQVVDEYNEHRCQLFNWVQYNGNPRIVSDVYGIYKTEYVDFVRGN